MYVFNSIVCAHVVCISLSSRHILSLELLLRQLFPVLYLSSPSAEFHLVSLRPPFSASSRPDRCFQPL